METGLGLMMSLVKRLNAMCADLCLKIGFKERYTDTVLTAERGWEARKMRLIDADETIREIVWNSLSESGEAIEATAKAIRCIENMPSIERKKGGWIKMSDADGTYWCCSECGEELYRQWSFNRESDLFPKKISIDKTNFCPNCGIDMREERNETD